MVKNSLNAGPSFSNPNKTTLANIHNNRPQIYVACLSSYNSGILYGAWIDAAQEVETILEQISTMLSKSPVPGAEEYAIHCQDRFYGLSVAEHASIEHVHEQAKFVLEHGELGAELAAYYGGNLEDAKTSLAEHYQGEYKTELDYAIELFDECYLNDIPKHVQSYIDYEQFKRDIFVDSYFSLEVEGSCHIFVRH